MKNYYNRARKLALVAFVLTLILSVIYSVLSLMNTTTANGYVEAIKQTLQTIIKEPSVAPQRISVSTDKGSSHIYNGEEVRFLTWSVPSQADKSVTYETDNPNCTITEEGEIVYTGTEYEEINVKVTSKLNPNVFQETKLYGFGLSPDDPRIERIEFRLCDNYHGSIDSDLDNLYTTKPYYLYPYAVIKEEYLSDFHLSSAEEQIRIYAYIDVISQDGNVINQRGGFAITFLKEGTSEFEVGFYNSVTGNFQRTPAKMSFSARFDEKYDYTPTKPLIPQITLGEDLPMIEEGEGVYRCVIPEDKRGFSVNVKWNGGNTLSTVEMDKDYAEVLEQTGRYFSKLVNRGEAVIYLKSLVNADMVTTLHVEFAAMQPTQLIVSPSTKNLSIFDENINYQFIFDKKVAFNGKLKAEVIEGNDIIEISEDGKNMKVKDYSGGKVVIRYTSTEFPELSTEVEYQVSLLGTLNNFISKIMGHFVVFSCLD